MKLTHVRLLVSDMGAAYRVRSAGGEVTDPVDRPDWGIRVAHVRDQDGNLVELYRDIEWERDA